jgi:paraquat-inducible protein B
MSESQAEQPGADRPEADLPEAEQPEVSRGRGISPIWIMPLLALALGLWMVVQSYLSEGPEIEVLFDTASGLEEGKTRLRYRNVQIGLVEEVALSADRTGVVARLKLEREAADMLREDTRFWVVTARLGAGAVSGLGTLLSGAYIEMAPGKGREGARSFVALDSPPLTPPGTRGLRLQLVSDGAPSLDSGDKVLYRGYPVGRVESAVFDPEEQRMRFSVFIDAPYHTLVNSSVRFWDVSGVSVSAGADGIKVQTGSLDTILFGGVTFGVPPGLPPGEAVEAGSRFRLYPDYAAITADPYQHGVYYVLEFSQSLRGLLPGAPVEYRGIPVGRVERIMIEEVLREGLTGTGVATPVLIYVEPARLGLPDRSDSIGEFQRSVEAGVANGMRAMLASGNLVTGSKYVSLDYYPDASPAGMESFGDYAVIPSISGGLERFEQKVVALLDRLYELPLEATMANANGAIRNLQSLLDSENPRSLVAGMDASLRELRGVLVGLSPAVAEMEGVVNNLDALARTLADRPNAVVFGTRLPDDPLPQAPAR